MTFPVVQFVASPDVDAAVRFDFNTAGEWADSETWPAHDGWSLGAPSLSGDPDGIGTEYGFREVSFNLIVKGTSAAVSSLVSSLARELGRQTNWLLFQLSPFSEPVWFKTYRSAPSALDFEMVRDIDDDARTNLWGVGVKLDAEPFAYGARITFPTVTVNNDPAAGTYPLSYELPAVRGDAPAPLRLAADFSAQLDQHDILWNLTATESSSAYIPQVWPIGTGDGLTAGTDTGAAVASSAFSGGSYRPVTFATDATLQTRLSGLTATTVRPGRYRVFVRMARSGTDGTYALRLGQAHGTGYLWGDTVKMDRNGTPGFNGHACLVDLGVFSFPRGANDIDLRMADYQHGIALQVQRLSGGSEARLDYFVAIPVDIQDGIESRTLVSQFPEYGPKATDLASYWDGDAEAFTRVNAAGAIDSDPQPASFGDFVRATPGCRNVLTLLPQVRATFGELGILPNSDDIALTTALTVSYRPRWLYLPDAS